MHDKVKPGNNSLIGGIPTGALHRVNLRKTPCSFRCITSFRLAVVYLWRQPSLQSAPMRLCCGCCRAVSRAHQQGLSVPPCLLSCALATPLSPQPRSLGSGSFFSTPAPLTVRPVPPSCCSVSHALQCPQWLAAPGHAAAPAASSCHPAQEHLQSCQESCEHKIADGGGGRGASEAQASSDLA
jgi:hypothetical protein